MPRADLLRLAISFLVGCPLAAQAQTDEIQVYDAEIAEPGQFEATLHNNYAPDGLKQPAFPGGTISNHSWNGALETDYGVTDWWELGLYMPVYTFTSLMPKDRASAADPDDPRLEPLVLQELWIEAAPR